MNANQRLAVAAALLAGLWPAAGRSNNIYPLQNRGGPMLRTPEIAPLYLGAWADSDIANTQAYLTGLVGYLNGQGAPRGRESVLRQYGVVGATLLPAVGPIPISYTTINRDSSDIPALIRAAQTQPGVYPYAPGRIIVAMTAGVASVIIPGGTALHDHDGDDHLYAFVPTELNGTGSTLQNLLSHEIFETATDPYWQNGASQKQAWIYWKNQTCIPYIVCWGDTAEGADECGQDQPLAFGTVSAFFDNARLACDAWSTVPQPVAGDFDRDGHADIALVGGYGSEFSIRAPRPQVPIAYSDGSGGFPRQTSKSTQFMDIADVDNVTVLSGDFDGDGATDIAMVGGLGWSTTPIFFSNRDGTFRFINAGDATFAAWAQLPGVQVVAADLDGDHRTDLALAGGPGWTTVPMAFSNGDGNFWIDNFNQGGAATFAQFMSNPGAKLIAGQFDSTGQASVGVVGIADQVAMFLKHKAVSIFNPVNFSFRYDQAFSEYSALPGVKAFTGDFDGDGFDDIALSGGPGWASVPIAFTSSTASGGFRVQNVVQWDFGVWGTVPGVTPLAGKFVNPTQPDIALVGGWGWTSVPINSFAPFPYSEDPQYELFRYVRNPAVGSNFPAIAQ